MRENFDQPVLIKMIIQNMKMLEKLQLLKEINTQQLV